jgi:hypothetical protein
MMDAIVIDLDGTLADCRHRIHLAHSRRWDEFNSELLGDIPFRDVEWFLKELTSHRDIIVLALTGRSDKYMDRTLVWLGKHGLSGVFDEVLMRPEGDYRSDHILKPLMLEEYFGSKEDALRNVRFILDDRETVVAGWREYGIPCWQVRPGGY